VKARISFRATQLARKSRANFAQNLSRMGIPRAQLSRKNLAPNLAPMRKFRATRAHGQTSEFSSFAQNWGKTITEHLFFSRKISPQDVDFSTSARPRGPQTTHLNHNILWLVDKLPVRRLRPFPSYRLNVVRELQYANAVADVDARVTN
jgi:hypothetical protein